MVTRVMGADDSAAHQAIAQAKMRVIEDFVEKIKQFDFESAFEEQVAQIQAEAEPEQEPEPASVQELLTQLLERLQSGASDLWPDAPLKDAEMFTHLNIEFDLGAGLIEIETAAKDIHGEPFYTYELQPHAAAEESDEEDAAGSDSESEEEGETVAVVEAEGEVALLGIDADSSKKILTVEEQREVAFKVVFFFISLIIASFGVLYIYHRMSQKNVN